MNIIYFSTQSDVRWVDGLVDGEDFALLTFSPDTITNFGQPSFLNNNFALVFFVGKTIFEQIFDVLKRYLTENVLFFFNSVSGAFGSGPSPRSSARKSSSSLACCLAFWRDNRIAFISLPTSFLRCGRGGATMAWFGGACHEKRADRNGRYLRD